MVVSKKKKRPIIGEQVMEKLFRVRFGFALLRSVIGSQNSRHILSQWEAKPKPIRLLHARIVIGPSNCFEFGFTTLN